MKRFTLSTLLFLILILTGCGKNDSSQPDINSITSYQDIPDISTEEIEAIEVLKEEKDSFSYGHLLETESFQLPDGTYAGFTIQVCALLSDLFDIEFIPQHCDGWESLRDGIDAQEIDFSGVFTPTAERMEIYSMTNPIAGRTLKLYTPVHSDNEIVSETDVNGLRIGFLSGTVTAGIVLDRYPELDFEVVEVPDFDSVTNMLIDGEMDGFVVAEVVDSSFVDYNLIQSKDFFSLVSTSVSITTANPDFWPIISVINKYLNAGGIDRMFELYDEGEHEYIKYKLFQSFTDEEKAYINDLTASNGKVDIGLQHDVYPVSFYNDTDKQFEGIALDILDEITRLTGIEFETITTSTDTPLSEILAKLKTGEISMMTQLLYTDSRKDDYLWSKIPYHTTQYALISKSTLPDMEISRVYYERVGTLNKSAHEEMFNLWFPDHEKHIIYSTSANAFDGLENDEIDLLMLSENMLLTQTNYREKPEFKINISFDKTLDSLFGYNKNEEVLCSIVDKTLAHIKTDKISDKWMSKVFDYSKKISQMQMLYLVAFSSVAFILLISMFVLLLKNKRLSKSLLERTATLTTIFTSIPDIIFCMDTNLTYTSCNPSFEKLSGLSSEEIIGKTDLEVFDPGQEMVAYFMEINKNVLDSEKTEVVQEWITYPDGTERYLETIKTPLFQDDKLTGLMGIARDITEHKAAEEAAQEASKAKSQFLANMSHEIRTPMNAIIGMSELLLNEPLTSRQQGYTNDINISSHSLLGIINDILDFSKIEAGKLDLTPVNYDFQVFIDNIRSMFKFVAQKKELSFIYDSEGELPKCLFGDDIRLRQVLTNICGNAVKFTSKGFIKLTVIATNDTLRFEIRDSGIGIHEEDIPKLFHAFTQADSQRNRNIKGTGLGLAISKNFAEMMGGDITVSSVYGEGTTFTVTIPMVLGDESAIRPENNAKNRKPFSAPSATILVVDDNDVNLKVASGLLNLYKIDAKTALSGKEAIQLIQETDFDIVFMDHMMPEMDGIETTEAIRGLGGKFEHLTIIALTANALQGAREMFLANSFQSFISKPIEVDELTEILIDWLPSEKIVLQPEQGSAPATAAVESESTDFLNIVKEISGINVEIGLSRVSGMEEMYCETLTLFTKKLLSDCDKIEGFLNDKDINNLAISVHGIKSSLSTIGAMELSGTALELEMASKNKDFDYCEAHFPEFLDQLRSLHKQLFAIIPAENTPVSRPEGTDAFLQENVQKALAAADDFDGDLGMEAIHNLLEYNFGEQTNALLERVNNSFLDFDFDAAVDLLNKILETE